MFLLHAPPADRHSTLEDAQGILIGATLVALSIQFLRASDLFTGQIAGLALIVAYPTGLSFGVLFFLFNLPFYALAVVQLGWRFTLKSLAAVTLAAILRAAVFDFAWVGTALLLVLNAILYTSVRTTRLPGTALSNASAVVIL